MVKCMILIKFYMPNNSICRQMHHFDMTIHPGSCKSGLTLTFAGLGFGLGLYPKGLGPLAHWTRVHN